MARPRNNSKRGNISLAGDIGPQTAAQMAGAEIVAAEGDNPNGRVQKRRENVLTRMHRNRTLTMRQFQAGQEIQEAYCGCERLSSGNSDYSKPIVDSSPVPDRFIDRQVDAHTRLKLAMSRVPAQSRAAVEAVCWHNQQVKNEPMTRAALKIALNRVADMMGL